jgi:hypothetical protein
MASEPSIFSRPSLKTQKGIQSRIVFPPKKSIASRLGPRESGPRESGPRESGPRESGPRESIKKSRQLQIHRNTRETTELIGYNNESNNIESNINETKSKDDIKKEEYQKLKKQIKLTKGELLNLIFLEVYPGKEYNEDELDNYILNYKYLDRNLADNFFNEETINNIDLLKWYSGKNKEFKKLSELEHIPMIEFKSLIITITLNLIKIIIDKKFPGKRKYTQKQNRDSPIESNKPNHSISSRLQNKRIRSSTRKKIYKPAAAAVAVVSNNVSDISNNNNMTDEVNKQVQQKLEESDIQKQIDTILSFKQTENSHYNRYLFISNLLFKICKLNLFENDKPNYFNYKDIMEIYLTYIAYMSGEFIKDIGYINVLENYAHKNKLDLILNRDFQNNKFINYIYYIHNIYKNTPFIIYPTFVQLHELKVIKTLSAPVINFYISYTRSPSHGIYISPIQHIEHDIVFHGSITHFHFLSEYYLNRHANKYNNNNSRKLSYLFDYKILIYKQYKNFSFLKTIYEILGPFFNSLHALLLKEQNQNLTNLIFELFHEHIESINNIFKNRNNNPITINYTIKNILNSIEFMKKIYNSRDQQKYAFQINQFDNFKKQKKNFKNILESLSENILESLSENSDRKRSKLNIQN